ncbi:MAG TPA: hypothetical protein DDY91_01660 [Planctomycetaceae bacterium]|nr:hypothetical protein [Planctomycetaceae bacterium]
MWKAVCRSPLAPTIRAWPCTDCLQGQGVTHAWGWKEGRLEIRWTECLANCWQSDALDRVARLH